ncbi:MAG: PKD domain-containing protein [Bacteroidia bacterium]
MSFKRLLALLFISSFCAAGISQVPGQYVFFKGDTLNGWDAASAYQDMLSSSRLNHLNAYEQMLFIRGKQENFVEKKYNLTQAVLRSVHVNPVPTTVCNNLGFETGDYTGWTGGIGYNFNSNAALTVTSPVITTFGIDYPEPSCAYHTLVNAAAGNDPFGAFPMLDPGGGSFALRLGGEWINLSGPQTGDSCTSGKKIGSQYYAGGEFVQQTFLVTSANAMFNYNYAVVLDKATHANGECPYFRAEVLDSAGNPIPCLQYYVQSDSSNTPAGMVVSSVANGWGGPVFYLGWTSNSLNLKPYLNHHLTVRFTAAGCTHGGHFGYAYVDASCSPVQVIASSPSVCMGGTISLTAPGASASGTYAWNTMPSGTAGIVGSTTGQTVTVNASGTYQVTVTQSPGCFYVIDTTVTFYPNPTITMTSTNATCSPGHDGTATATPAGGNGPYTYTWTPAPGGGQGTANATGLSAGTYSVTVSSVNGCTATNTVVVTQPAGQTLSPASTNVQCFGQTNGSASVTVAGGTAPYTYSWTGSTSLTGSAPNLAAGNYTCSVTDASGCTATQTFTITQPALLTVTATGVNATCSGKCNGQLICVPAGGTTTYSYSWNNGSTSPSVNNICAGTYTATITDAHGCTTTDTALIKQPTPLAMNMFPIKALCGKANGSDSVSVSGGTPGYTYSWTPGTGSSASSYHGLPAGNYTVFVKDANGCPDTLQNSVASLSGVSLVNVSVTNVSCFGGHDGTAKDSASGGVKPYTFLWSPAPGGGQGTASVTGLSAGTYTCMVTDSAGCNTILPVTLTQPTAVSVASGPATICIGSCTNLGATGSGGTPAYTFSWTQNTTPLTSLNVCPTVTTTYTVICTDSYGCLSPPLPVTVKVDPPLEILATGAKSVCPGGTSQLTSTASGGDSVYTYQWIPAAGLSSATISNPVATPSVTTTYTVIVSDNCGTPTDSAMVTVTVYPLPVVSFTSQDTVVCSPVCATFVGTSNPPCASATWIFGDGGTGTGCGTVHHCYYVAGTYPVTYNVTDIHGCIGTMTIPNFINALPRPEAAFTDSPNPATILNPMINFTNTSTNGISYRWTFGDPGDSASVLQNPTHTYLDTGCYNVTLIVWGNNGCTDTAMHPVCIRPDFTFYAPNTFTPNGDGKNEEWMPYGIGIDPNNYDLMMFDRWGNLMFETHTWGHGWDGRANQGSNIAQIDTYVWKVNLKDVLGNKHHYEGHCNLIK